MALKVVYAEGKHRIDTERKLINLVIRAVQSGRLLDMTIYDDRGGNGGFVVRLRSIDGAPL